MAVYEVTVDSEGRIVLPREIVARVGARPGDRLGVAEVGSSAATWSDALSIRPVAPRSTNRGAGDERGAGPRNGGLDALKDVARRARAEGVAPAVSADPVGDFLVEEDRRSRGL